MIRITSILSQAQSRDQPIVGQALQALAFLSYFVKGANMDNLTEEERHFINQAMVFRIIGLEDLVKKTIEMDSNERTIIDMKARLERYEFLYNSIRKKLTGEQLS